MHISTTIKPTNSLSSVKRSTPTTIQSQSSETTADQVSIDWSGSKPAHRNVKKLARTVAAGIGAVGLGATAFKALTAATAGQGLLNAGIGLAATAAALTAFDVGSGLAHHAGDNYFNPHLPHTQWHTQPTDAEYCLVGFSNKALDSVEFFPKWERLVSKATGAEPISWRVPEYKAYCLGEISAQELHKTQVQNGMVRE